MSAFWVFATMLAGGWPGSQETTKTIIQVSKDQKRGRGLGTASYGETEREAPFLKKIDRQESDAGIRARLNDYKKQFDFSEK